MFSRVKLYVISSCKFKGIKNIIRGSYISGSLKSLKIKLELVRPNIRRKFQRIHESKYAKNDLRTFKIGESWILTQRN